MMVDLDTHGRKKVMRSEPDRELKIVQIEPNPDQTTRINNSFFDLLDRGAPPPS